MTTTKPRDGTRMILEALANAIKTSGRSVAQIADRGGFARQYIYQVLAGNTNPTLDTIERLFEACDDDFADWLVADWGHDKVVYKQLQQVLEARGELAIAARATLQGWVNLIHTLGEPQTPAKARRLVPRRKPIGMKTDD